MIKNCANVQFAHSKYYLYINLKYFYSKTLIYHGVWGKETSAINQGICGTSGFCLFTLYMLKPYFIFGGKEMATEYQGLRSIVARLIRVVLLIVE